MGEYQTLGVLILFVNTVTIYALSRPFINPLPDFVFSQSSLAKKREAKRKKWHKKSASKKSPSKMDTLHILEETVDLKETVKKKSKKELKKARAAAIVALNNSIVTSNDEGITGEGEIKKKSKKKTKPSPQKTVESSEPESEDLDNKLDKSSKVVQGSMFRSFEDPLTTKSGENMP